MATLEPRQTCAPSLWAVAGAFAIVYIVWGSTYLAIKFAIETMPPFLMAGVRFSVAGGLLFAFLRWRDPVTITRRQWISAAIIGSLMLLGGNGLVCWAEQTVPSGIAALIIATMPIWFALLDWLMFHGPRPTPRIVMGLVIGLIGMYVLIGPNRLGGEQIDVMGAIALLLACVFWTLGSLWSRRADLPQSSFTATAMEMLTGGAALILVGLCSGEGGALDAAAVTLKSALALGYLIIFGSLVALSAYVWLLQVSTPARVSTYAYVNPVIALFLGAVLANESLNARIWTAVAMIISAVVLITTSRRSAPPAAERTVRADQHVSLRDSGCAVDAGGGS